MAAAHAGEWEPAARAALGHYAVEPVALEPIAQGLINLTIRVSCADGRRFVLQRLHEVFGASVNDNIVLVTTHLRRRGVLTPELVPTRAGAWSVALADGRWRLMSHIAGEAYDALDTPAQAREAGRQLGDFHRALADFSAALTRERPPVHDLPRHLETLERARADHAGHRHAAAVAALAAELATLEATLPPLCLEPPRLVHGDPKVSNILFEPGGTRALCLVDLDTLAWMPLAYELGDALRSWCNRRGEDAADAVFDLELFCAALEGYTAAAADFVTASELGTVVPATLAIHLELAARFLTDTLEERYFSWDARRYVDRAAHNLARARGQLAAAASLHVQRAAAQAIVARVAVAHGLT